MPHTDDHGQGTGDNRARQGFAVKGVQVLQRAATPSENNGVESALSPGGAVLDPRQGAAQRRGGLGALHR